MSAAVLERTQECEEKVCQPGDHPVKTTAYLWIIDAVIDERYEDIPEMIKVAHHFGARRWDIRKILGIAVQNQRKREYKRRRESHGIYAA